MSCYIVLFEVQEASRLSALTDALKSYSSYCPVTAHAWAVITETGAKEVRDKLLPLVGRKDQIFVIRSGTEGAWLNAYGPKHSEWLKKNL
ncbi:MAG: hypothetical protein A2Y21_12005 [Clostridiales bacterium GWC2_40_7]|nr:MAG: hypothetical protein A2Y21_12005 [Clostridiales bacterium GWC2_40_7]